MVMKLIGDAGETIKLEPGDTVVFDLNNLQLRVQRKREYLLIQGNTLRNRIHANFLTIKPSYHLEDIMGTIACLCGLEIVGPIRKYRGTIRATLA